MHPTTRKELKEALRLRKSHPGLSQDELAKLVSKKAHGDEDYLNPRSPVGLVMYQTYLGGIEVASQFSQLMFAGVDMTEGY